jgi:hypothetical protein
MAEGHLGNKGALSRRSFITIAAGTAGAVAYGDKIRPRAESVPLSDVTRDAAALIRPDFAVVMRRPADQCVLTLGFWNMGPAFAPTVAPSPSTFDIIDSSKPAYLTVTMGVVGLYLNALTQGFDSPAPQNIIETSFPVVGGLDSATKSQTLPKLPGQQNTHQSIRPSSTPALGKPAIAAIPAGPSTLAFVVPATMLGPDSSDPLLLDTDSLLNWTGLRLSTVPAALPPLTSVSQAPAGFKARDVVKPRATQTAIEMPYNLILSPPASPERGIGFEGFESSTLFRNATQPVTAGDWTELWHTRMGVRYAIFVEGITNGDEPASGKAKPDITIGHNEIVVSETNRDLMTVRAVFCLDPKFVHDLDHQVNEPADPASPVKHPSLRYADRYDIVQLSSNFTSHMSGGPLGRSGQGGVAFIPTPATVDRLMLSSLGGWLECDAHWDLAPGGAAAYNSSLLSWRHRASQGRDSYVRVVRKGYLYPWGHLASLITITEREIGDYQGHPGAYLRQKTFIVVSNPIKNYGQAGDFAPYKGHGLPFTSVEAVTLVTPPIKESKSYTAAQGVHNPELCFQPELADGSPYLFHMRGTDWAGAQIDFHSPVVWVDDTKAYGGSKALRKITDELKTNWNKKAPTIPLHGQRVSVAPPVDTTKPGDTQFVVSSFVLDGTLPTSAGSYDALVRAGQPRFYPLMNQMSVAHPELSTAAGAAVGGSTFVYDKAHYLANNGFGGPNNKGALFLNAADLSSAAALVFKSDHSGGGVTPNIHISAISRAIGPVSGSTTTDINALATGAFTPTTVFADSGAAAAKLLGGIPLSAIIEVGHFLEGGTNADSMTVTTKELTAPYHRIETRVDWHPQLKNYSPSSLVPNLFQPYLDGDPSTGVSPTNGMDLHALVVTSLDPSKPSSTTVTGQIRQFNLNLFGDSDTYFIQIPIDSLSFRAQTGQKTDVQVQVNPIGVGFEGALSFVQDLASYLAFDGSGIIINTAGSAITADLTLAIPNITVGIFSLNNLAFSAGVTIPYNGDPVAVNFSFCSVENPFQLDVMIFSGTGYVTLTIGPTGVQGLSIGFGFGFGYSLNIGIASGQVSLTGGINYTSQETAAGQEVMFTAYVKASGGISALGIISVSVELYLGLTWDGHADGSSSLIGTATLTISVHILFFGFSVGVSMSEEFAGSGPTHANNAKLRRSDNESYRAQRLKQAGAHAALAAKSSAKPDVTPPPFMANKTEPNTFGGSMTNEQWAMYCASFAVVTAS